MSDWFFKKIHWFAGYIVILCLFGLIVLAANIEIKDVDLWLHLAVGKFITQTFSIPKTDILSCTIANTPWINHEWLFQSIVYSVYNATGVEGLINLKVWIVFITFVLLFFMGYTHEHRMGPIIVLLLALLVYQLRLTLRPDIFSLLFFVLYVGILGRHLDKRWSLWAIGLIQVVWTNMHGFFIFGPIIIAIGLLGEWVKRNRPLPYDWNKAGRLSKGEYQNLKQLLVIAVLACLVNPHFIKGALYPLGVLFSLGGESKVFFEKIVELQRPLQWHTLFSLESYFHYKLLIVISFLSFILNRRRLNINVLLLWLLFLVFSLSAIRNLVFFAFAAYFAFLANVPYISTKKLLPARFTHGRIQSFCLIAVQVFIIVWIIDYSNQLLLRGYYDFDKFERKSEYGGTSLRNFPYKAADFLVANDIKGNFFNDFNSGAYLLGRTFPNIKVFVDGRTEVYGAQFYKKHTKIWKGDTKLFDEAVDTYGLTGAFLNSVYVPAPSKLIRYLYDHKDWALVYFDYDATIFLRDIPQNRPWINRLRINLARRQTPDADLLKIGIHKVTPYRHVLRSYALYNMGLDRKAYAEATQALRIQPYNTKAHKLLGLIHNERKEYNKAFESLRKAKLMEPDDMKVRYQMAVALYHLGEVDKAKEQCQRVFAQGSQGAGDVPPGEENICIQIGSNAP